MRCSNCKTENPTGKKFCGDCGAALANLCPKCGADNPAGKRFCGECGTALGARAAVASTKKSNDSPIRVAGTPAPENLEGERKTVTALFADIKGSTELEQDLDPEEARAIIDPALKLMIEAVQRYDGYIVQSTGDGIFALFGAPVAHEDHPQRALYAALRMQEELKRYSAKLVADGGMPIEARIGANTGEVVVRSISTGGGHVEYTPIGHTTNLASRMQAVAPTGSIAISEQTRKFVEGYFQLKPMGPTRVKGVSEPVNVYEVTGLGPLRTRLQRSAGRGLSKFVGRQAEIDALKRAADQAQAGRGQIVAAMAEAGTGKSRLFFEFKAVAQSGWMVLETFSVSHGKASAYLPVIALLHGYFEILAGDDERKRREKVTGRVLALDRSLEDTIPYLFSLLGIAEGAEHSRHWEQTLDRLDEYLHELQKKDPLAQMDAQLRKRRTLDAIKRILIRESLNQPLMVIFEDLHWIDDETQVLLNLLADSIGTAKILLLVNYRPEYSHQWGSKTYYTQLRLDPLGKESAEEMLSSLLGDGKDLVALKRLIIEKTEGNPFFMEETVEMLLDAGALVRNGSIKLVKQLAELKIPPTVQAILASRIDRLPPDEKALLQTLAVIGREFPFGLIRSAVAKPDDELNRMLGDLQLAEFIYEQPAAGDIEYTFKHALTQEVAYQSVLVERRKVLHEKIGAAIEALASIQIDDHLSQLAYHYGRSSNVGKTVEYLDRAGRQAMMRGVFNEAELHFKQAIAALSTTSETPERIRREFNLQYALWQVLAFTSHMGAGENLRASRRLRELGEKTGNPEQLIVALRAAWGPALEQGDMTAAQQIAEQLLEIAQRSGSRLGLTLAHHFQGICCQIRGELTQAMQHFEATIASYNETDFIGYIMVDLHVGALLRIGVALWHVGNADQGRAKIREAISLSEGLKKPGNMAFALQGASAFYVYLREPAHVHEVAERLFTLASELQMPPYVASGSFYRGWAMAEQGRPDEGVALIRTVLDSAATLGLPANAETLRVSSEAQARAGQLEEALATIEQAFSAVGEQQIFLPEVLWWRGELHLMRGEETLAGRDFQETITVSRRMGSKAYELRATTSLARLLGKQGRRDEARAMLSEIYNWFTEGFDIADLKDAKALLDALSE
jgi:class 3 adenylate cyclase/tetratricopeptide (TPR) repeat protein